MATNGLPNGDSTSSDSSPIIETPYLIVGAGPAGASLACFLASYGLKGIMISAAPGTAKEPRAHITNPAAQECLRDIGLDDAVQKEGTAQVNMSHTRWCHDMAGEEWARIHSWGNQPERHGEYEAASPCKHVDCPQTILEPILVNRAREQGWKVRFDSSFVEYARDAPAGPITSTIQDTLTGHKYQIRSKYLFGCDGGRSPVMRQVGIPLKKEPGQGLAINVHARADLSKHMKHKEGVLHWVFQPEIDHPPWAWSVIVRMVNAWNEWMFIVLPEPGFEDFSVRPSHEEYTKRMKQCIGDDSVDFEIIDVAKWYINEIVAERYSDGNIHLLGDSVHRHPPFNGLGSNTCVQDAFNLAWKVAYVDKGMADPSLLATFSEERQPIGEGVIRRANQGLRDHVPVFEALGVLPSLPKEERIRQHAELSAPTAAGRERRKKLKETVAYTAHEFGGIGIEMNQRYESSAVYMADEKEARRPPPADPVLTYQLSTYPGSRLPHAWINTRKPGKPISTIDLAGHGAFTVLTGIGGDNWKSAAEKTASKFGVKVNAYSIGWTMDWEDMYGDWADRREIEEDGVIVCRPDRTICWRSMEMREDAEAALEKAVGSVLGRV